MLRLVLRPLRSRYWFLCGHKPSFGLWVGCERAGLLREQEQETANDVDLRLDAVERTEGGAMPSGFEVVRRSREPGQNLGVDGHGPVENALADCFVRILWMGFCAGFSHWVFLCVVGCSLMIEKDRCLSRRLWKI